MTTAAANLSVLVGKHFACVKICGRANFNSSVDFKTLLNELLGKGYSYFVMDLSDCILMDSTFLGVLTGFGIKLSQQHGESAPRAIELLNPHERVADLLENLGVMHLFKVSRGPLFAPENLEAHAHEPAQHSQEELTHACLEAHQTLMAVNPENVARFKDVTRFLAEDLHRMKKGA